MADLINSMLRESTLEEPYIKDAISQALLTEQIAIYPWFHNQLENILEHHDSMSHALLVTGQEGVGKIQFAKHVVYHWLLKSETNSAQIRKRIHQHHPDLHVISSSFHYQNNFDSFMQEHASSYLTESQLTSKKPSKIINIDQIRRLTEKLQLHPLRSNYKIAIIYPAERLNSYAANALLKTLEEPPGNSKIILLVDNFSLIPETIRSRCLRVTINAPSKDNSRKWLKPQYSDVDDEIINQVLDISNNAPLLAKKFLDNQLHLSIVSWQQGIALLISRQANPLQLAQNWMAELTKSAVDISVLYRWLCLLLFSVYQHGMQSLNAQKNTLNPSLQRNSCAVNNENLSLINQMVKNYSLADKEIYFDSYLSLYKLTERGVHLSLTSVDQNLYLEQILTSIYKLNRK